MKIAGGTITRTVILTFALLNQILAALGKSPIPITDEEIQTIVTTVITIIAAVSAWWKNNSFTSEAVRADHYLNKLRGKSL